MTTAHDLLVEPLVSWRDAQRRTRRTTLPGILAKLASGELTEFHRVRAHQFDPWCMFLTQVAAIALRRAKKSEPSLSEAEWRTHLLALTDGSHEPWCLVVDDLSQAAFLQPPVPECEIRAWSRCEHPDDIDVLVTAKSHDVKASVIFADDVEAWIFALVALQTMQGYPGRGYTRTARMKGGYGSRARVGLAADRTVSSRFARDVQVLLDSWNPLVEMRGFSDTGLALVWTAPWNGRDSLTMPELSPHFVEVCWRLRCTGSAGGVTCAYTTTQNRRCLPEIEDGDAGDPWLPIEREGGGALTVGRGGFHYEILTRVLFQGDFEPAAAQVSRPDDGDPVLFLASVMARGQGKTEGLHERVIPLTGTARRRLGEPDMRAAVGKRASGNVQRAKQMRSKVLFAALHRLALGEDTHKDEFDDRIDEVFFDDLFAMLDQPDDDAQLAWDRRLHEVAWAELQRAIDRCCVPSARWYRAVSDAEGVFWGCLRKQFPTLVAAAERGALQRPTT